MKFFALLKHPNKKGSPSYFDRALEFWKSFCRSRVHWEKAAGLIFLPSTNANSFAKLNLFSNGGFPVRLKITGMRTHTFQREIIEINIAMVTFIRLKKQVI